MPVDSIYDVTRAGLSYERLRLDAASRNVAGANVPLAPGQQAVTAAVSAESAGFAGLVTAPAMGEQPVGVREVHDPGHPMADERGMVRYAEVDMVGEMTTLMSASRGYEANVRAFNLLRSMTLRALEIGAK